MSRLANLFSALAICEHAICEYQLKLKNEGNVNFKIQYSRFLKRLKIEKKMILEEILNGKY